MVNAAYQPTQNSVSKLREIIIKLVEENY
jgi:hypothetical protein